MTRILAVFGVLALLSVSTAGRAQTGRSSTTPTLALESLTGRDSFDRYCASCHGADARGGGPVAAALKTRPSDLTTLARRNGGSFPRQRVASFVEGAERSSPAHGSGEMPVWGQTLRGLESSDTRVRVRLANLVAYVESLQLPAEQAAQGRSAEPSGAQLFRTYCASCHGENGRGGGPISAQLRTTVPNLTTFSARNGGVFPAERVRQMIDGRGPAAHGDRSMPVWGDVFRRQEVAGDTAASRIESIVTFLQSIQQRPAE